jgi:hypothetical protein
MDPTSLVVMVCALVQKVGFSVERKQHDKYFILSAGQNKIILLKQ